MNLIPYRELAKARALSLIKSVEAWASASSRELNDSLKEEGTFPFCGPTLLVSLNIQTPSPEYGPALESELNFDFSGTPGPTRTKNQESLIRGFGTFLEFLKKYDPGMFDESSTPLVRVSEDLKTDKVGNASVIFHSKVLARIKLVVSFEIDGDNAVPHSSDLVMNEIRWYLPHKGGDTVMDTVKFMFRLPFLMVGTLADAEMVSKIPPKGMQFLEIPKFSFDFMDPALVDPSNPDNILYLMGE